MLKGKSPRPASGLGVKGGGGEPVGPFVEVCHLFTLHIFMRLKQAIRHLHMHNAYVLLYCIVYMYMYSVCTVLTTCHTPNPTPHLSTTQGEKEMLRKNNGGIS